MLRAGADLGVLILDPINLSKRLSLANKIFRYMAAGIPLLTTNLPENRRIVEVLVQTAENRLAGRPPTGA